ncbi:hypothetical protein RclHR1_10690007 [Rhizophagus clarus]|uniref:Uncharacterized protein n=1 Tax=Rhizophagus clarus TaxID=94130 RepID=A0A2Z6QGX2_9GLOM|nr:hypothetical protein RclHR1_10690007 [Rhizophagus clarus]
MAINIFGEDNTNAVEAAHALNNREGKQLTLIALVKKGMMKIKVPKTIQSYHTLKLKQIASNRKAAEYNKNPRPHHHVKEKLHL